MESTLIELLKLILNDTKLKIEDWVAWHQTRCPSRGKYVMLGMSMVFHDVSEWYITIREDSMECIYHPDKTHHRIKNWLSVPCSEEGFFQYSLIYDLGLFTPAGLQEIKDLYNEIMGFTYV